METAFSSTHIDPDLVACLSELSSESAVRKDAYGNEYLWSKLAVTADLPRAAAILQARKARLCTVTALSENMYTEPVICLDYHFDVEGAVVTVMVALDPTDNSVPTITPHFRNADWCEREVAELYDLHVDGNTNPERLFLDDNIDQGILNEVIPLSIMMNGACTTDMWEHITALNLNAAPHSVFPKPEGPAEPWPPVSEPGPHVHGSPLPGVTDSQHAPKPEKPEKPAKAGKNAEGPAAPASEQPGQAASGADDPDKAAPAAEEVKA